MAQSTLCDTCGLVEHQNQYVRGPNVLWTCDGCWAEWILARGAEIIAARAQLEEAAVAVAAGPMTIEEAGPAETPEARPRPQEAETAATAGSAGVAQAGEDDRPADDQRGDDRLEPGTGGGAEPG